jgi:hypothetical protein
MVVKNFRSHFGLFDDGMQTSSHRDPDSQNRLASKKFATRAFDLKNKLDLRRFFEFRN